MIQDFIIRLNGKPFLREGEETYRGGDTWSSNSFNTRSASRSVVLFGEDGADTGKVITGIINLKSYLDKIIRYAATNNIGIRSIEIVCAVCGGSGGVETGENEISACVCSECEVEQRPNLEF